MSVAPLDRSLIRGLALFEGMDEMALDDLLAVASGRRYAAGEVVFGQGQPATEFYVLLHGRLRVTQLTADGQQVVIRMVNPGDLFGIARALQRPDYPGTATAVADSVALSWPMAAWSGIIDQHPAFAVATMNTVGTRLQEAHTRIREMSTEAVERRVGHAVLRLVKQAGKHEVDGVRIDFPVTKQDLAEMSGTTLFTVSRILGAWQDAGIVDAGRQKLIVRDPHRLLLIADGVEAGLLR